MPFVSMALPEGRRADMARLPSMRTLSGHVVASCYRASKAPELLTSQGRRGSASLLAGFKEPDVWASAAVGTAQVDRRVPGGRGGIGDVVRVGGIGGEERIGDPAGAVGAEGRLPAGQIHARAVE